MNAPLLPERLLRREPSPDGELEFAADGVQRVVWEARYGAMLIEVRDGEVFVDGQRVEPAPPQLRAGRQP